MPEINQNTKLIIASQYYYCLVRFIHVLYERIIKMRKLIKDQLIYDNQRNCSKLSEEDLKTLEIETTVDIFMNTLMLLLKAKIE